MKKTILGILIGLVLYPAGLRVYNSGQSILDKNCTSDISRNGFGWVFIRREYYRCNRLETLVSNKLYDSLTQHNHPELEPKVNHKARF